MSVQVHLHTHQYQAYTQTHTNAHIHTHAYTHTQHKHTHTCYQKLYVLRVVMCIPEENLMHVMLRDRDVDAKCNMHSQQTHKPIHTHTHSHAHGHAHIHAHCTAHIDTHAQTCTHIAWKTLEASLCLVLHLSFWTQCRVPVHFLYTSSLANISLLCKIRFTFQKS